MNTHRQAANKKTPGLQGIDPKRWLVPAAMVILLVLLVITISRIMQDDASNSATTPAPTVAGNAPAQVHQPEQPDFSAVEKRDPDDALAIGDIDAPVVLVAFSDYQCPYCAAWSADTLPLLLDKVETGQLRIEWRELAVFGPSSAHAARASYAAGLQDAFLEMHQKLFTDGEISPANELEPDALVALAASIGLDSEQFARDMNSEVTTEHLQENSDVAMSLGVFSTPAFILGGEAIIGARPPQIFLDAFDKALAATK